MYVAAAALAQHPAAAADGREALERALLEELPCLRPITAAQSEQVDRYKDGSFGCSLLGHMLYGNGYNLRGQSILCPNGLLYEDGRVCFGVGIFRRALADSLFCVMVCAPRGEAVCDRVEAFLGAARRTLGNRVAGYYVRHLDEDLYAEFRARGYHPIEESPWDPRAPSEDEHFNHKLVDFERILAGPTDAFTVRTLGGSENKRFRHKARLAHNRFENFLARNDAKLRVLPYGPAFFGIGHWLVRRHFESLASPVGSTPEDYFSLLRFDGSTNSGYFGRIGFLEHAGRAAPIMLFVGENCGRETVSLYATFALRRPDGWLPKTRLAEISASGAPGDCADLSPDWAPTAGEIRLDHTGLSAISQYCYLQIFNELRARGVRYANLGGSETADLDRFKRQLGASEASSYWVVAPAQSHPVSSRVQSAESSQLSK